MATVTSYTSAAVDAALAAKADLSGGVVPDAQAPSNTVKKDSWLISVMDHGGHGDGVTPDDSAVISALAAVNPTWGGKVYFPPGKYLLTGSAAIALSNFGTILEGAGFEASKLVIGSGFTATQVITITGNDCAVRNLSIAGSNTTTTSNPVADAIGINSAQRTKITDCYFKNVNGWAVNVVAGSTSGTNPSGTMLRGLVIRLCAGGISFLGNSGSGSVSSFLTDIQIISTGVTTGAAANLDAVKFEDASSVLIENLLSWMAAGSGSSLHIKGLTNAFYVSALDAQGTSAGPTVLIEDGTHGSPKNLQFQNGTVQLGSIGLRITGGASDVTLKTLSLINNVTHGLSIEGTANPQYCHNLYFVNNGTGAAGTNYDINWSGSSIGFINDTRFETTISTVGIAGVQKSINVPALQGVRCINVSFAGAGAASTNWFTNVPNAVLETSGGTFDFLTAVNFANGVSTSGNVVSNPAASTNTVLSAKVPGDGFDRFRITGDGSLNVGTGALARDTTWGRQGAAQIGTADSDVIIGLAGKGLRIKEGTNARMGTATLAAGTVTVANTSITANTRIILGVKTPGTAANCGALFVTTVTLATSFIVKSTNASDTSVISYVLFEAA
jgi:hypothetical protein